MDFVLTPVKATGPVALSHIGDDIVHDLHESLEIVEILKRILFLKYRLSVFFQIVGTRGHAECTGKQCAKHIYQRLFHFNNVKV
jgi:hypothetical protein